MAFHDVRLPDEIERGASGGPEFTTTIIGMSSGREQRNIDWEEVRSSWELSYGVQDKLDFDAVKAFFYARRGRGYGFRFKDWGDFELTDEPIGLGDGVENDFQIVKTYESGGPLPYIRVITRPVQSSLKVKIDGVETGSWSLQPSGVIRLSSPLTSSAVLTVSGEFDVPVRFDTDKFQLILETSQAGAIGSLSIVELRE